MKIRLSILLILGLFVSCSVQEITRDEGPDQLHTEELEALAVNFEHMIFADGDEFPILEKSQHSRAYGYLAKLSSRLRTTVGSENMLLRYYIVARDDERYFSVLPNQSIFITTGLLKSLSNDNEVGAAVSMIHAMDAHSAGMSNLYQDYSIDSLRAASKNSKFCTEEMLYSYMFNPFETEKQAEVVIGMDTLVCNSSFKMDGRNSFVFKLNGTKAEWSIADQFSTLIPANKMPVCHEKNYGNQLPGVVATLKKSQYKLSRGKTVTLKSREDLIRPQN